MSTLLHRPKTKRPPPKPRRARGTGPFFWSPSLKLYVGRVKVGTKPDGRPHYVERRAATQEELLRKLGQVQPPGPKTTLAEWVERWFASVSIRDSSRRDYRHTFDYFVLPALGTRAVRDLTTHDVERMMRAWTSLGPNTARKNLAHLRVCLEDARRARLIAENPARDARPPKARRVVIDPFSPEELRTIITTPGAGLFAAMASVGCRLGEALALDVGDWNRTTGELSITKTYDAKHGVRRPKSENGIRTVRVPALAIPAIEAAIGKRTAGPLFHAKGKPKTRRAHAAVRNSWKAFLRKLGLRYRRTHQLRQSVATVWVSKGVPVGDVAKKLGDSVATVIKTYIHPFGTDPTDAMEAALAGR